MHGDKKSDGKGYAAKINTGVDGSFFELVENAKYDYNQGEKGKSTSSHQDVEEWHYYTKTVEIDGELYDKVINIRDKGNNQYVYDVTVKEHKKRGPYSKPRAYNGKNQMATAENGDLALNDTIAEKIYMSRETIKIRVRLMQKLITKASCFMT